MTACWRFRVEINAHLLPHLHHKKEQLKVGNRSLHLLLIECWRAVNILPIRPLNTKFRCFAFGLKQIVFWRVRFSDHSAGMEAALFVTKVFRRRGLPSPMHALSDSCLLCLRPKSKHTSNLCFVSESFAPLYPTLLPLLLTWKLLLYIGVCVYLSHAGKMIALDSKRNCYWLSWVTPTSWINFNSFLFLTSNLGVPNAAGYEQILKRVSDFLCVA